MPALDDEPRNARQPGESAARSAPRESRRLAEPPSARYAPPTETSGPTTGDEATATSSALTGPLTRATVVAASGAVLLTIVGAVLASTAGLLFVAGLMGAVVGLVLSGAAVPVGAAAPVPRRRLAWLATGLSIGAVALAAVATWVYAQSEGGTLGLLDYLLTTFGPFVPAEAVLAALAAWWGATTGPVQS